MTRNLRALRVTEATLGSVMTLSCTEEAFVPRWRVERLRVLAVVADPPDARPGDTITLTVHTAQPDIAQSTPRVLWVTCPRLFLDNTTGARRCEGPPVLQEGTTVHVRMGDAPKGGAPWPFLGIACTGLPRLDSAMARLDCDGDGEPFLRTVRIRTNIPNHNPRIARITLGNTLLAPEAPTPIPPGTASPLQVDFAPDAREPIPEVQPDGTIRTLREALLTQYLTDRGTLEGSFRSDDDGPLDSHRIRFAAPSRGTVRIWVVLSDGRGGFDVASRTLVVAP